MQTRILPFLICSFLPFTQYATIWQVGPGQTYTMPSQVSTLVGDGDTVNIAAGTYASDVARWQANDLLLRGVGGLAHLESNGNAWGGKAIWVIQGDRTTVEWIEFSECTVPDMNGAGIRQEGKHLTVRHCYFHDNENGILAGDVNPSTIRIEYTEFDHNGFGDGFSHNLYINHVDSLIFRYNYSHHAHVGQELKSRAHVNIIEYNRFSNEADGDASREIDLPNGGQAFVIGNVIQQGPMGENSNLVGFGNEGLSNPGPHEFHAINNTLVNEKTVGSFFSVPPNAYCKTYNNVLAGSGTFFASPAPTLPDTVGNLRSVNIADVLFNASGAYDYHIGTDSPAHASGFPAGYSNSGYALVAWDEYVHPTSSTLRCQHATLDIGAFETCTTSIVDDTAAPAFRIWPNPAYGTVMISANGAFSFHRISLFDPTGRLVRDFQITQGDPIALDLRGVGSGSHVLKAWSIDGTWTRPIVVLGDL